MFISDCANEQSDIGRKDLEGEFPRLNVVDDRKAKLMMLLRGNYLITGQQQQNKVSWQKITLNDLDQ